MQATLIPVNTEGKQNDLRFSVTLPDHEKAVDCFKRACKRLLNPPVWHELGGFLGGEFTLISDKGGALKRLAKEGDLFQIDLPGTGPKVGGGYDWVKVDAIEDRSDEPGNEALFAMRVTPAVNPNNSDPATAHFFKAGASSTFVVQRKGNEVTASYHGRNEMPNNATNHAIDNIRNTVIAASAAVGLSEVQWSALIKALLEPEIGG
jgi:hypothetical protein